MKIKYNRVSHVSQSGNRFTEDNDTYDLVIMDKVSGSVSFKDRVGGKKVVELVENGSLETLVSEEFSRLGRNTGDVIRTLEWLDENKVNVIIRNLGLQSRPNGQKNPIWKMISSVMSSLYEMELENIKERTSVGLQVYIQNGGKLGRPVGSNQSEHDFLQKETTQKVLFYLKKGKTVRDISHKLGCSNSTVIKTKKLAIKHQLINTDKKSEPSKFKFFH
ncbi:recombinase family protein [Aquirufa sp.]|jgi:DNA invertase Pin-like site-specific DNA recombinase|uniref:recombinase family protein n=1 Tax=Aquirufa sp. TaxID=2676249 RepID=UPI003783FCE2